MKTSIAHVSPSHCCHCHKLRFGRVAYYFKILDNYGTTVFLPRWLSSYRLLVRKPEGRSPLGRPRRRKVDNIRMDLGEVGWGDMDWIGLAKDRNRWRALANSVLILRVP
jgi:hypothetical protein